MFDTVTQPPYPKSSRKVRASMEKFRRRAGNILKHKQRYAAPAAILASTSSNTIDVTRAPKEAARTGSKKKEVFTGTLTSFTRSKRCAASSTPRREFPANTTRTPPANIKKLLSVSDT